MALEKQVQSVRAASRDMVRELGMLAAAHGSLGVTNSQCHALIAVGSAGSLGIQELASQLVLDTSTVSRLVDVMKADKLIAVEPDPDDKRKKRLTVTATGKKKLQGIHSQANERVESALALMSEKERESLIIGLTSYARTLRKSRRQALVKLRPIKQADNLHLKKIVVESLTEYDANRPGFAAFDPDLDDLNAEYSKSRSRYYVAELDGEVVGGAGFSPFANGDKGICELKRMYLKPHARNFGLGRMLLEKCLTDASHAGYKRCYLETLCAMGAANKLYEKFGFKQIAKPLGVNGNCGCDKWMVRDL